MTGCDRRPLDELTRREREVVHLAIQGRTNAQIAAALFRSPKTIDNHLSRAYQKLGVSNRVELANAMAWFDFPVHEDVRRPDELRTEIGRHREALSALLELERRLAGVEAGRFAWALAVALTDVLGVRYAGVSAFLPGTERRCTTVIAERGCPLKQIELPFEECPCSLTMREGRFMCHSGLRERYNHFRPFAEMGIEANVGVSLNDRMLGQMGSLWVMDTEPIDPDRMLLEVLELFAPRTASELAMQRVIDELHELQGEDGYRADWMNASRA